MSVIAEGARAFVLERPRIVVSGVSGERRSDLVRVVPLGRDVKAVLVSSSC
jgi:hypothetical protein